MGSGPEMIPRQQIVSVGYAFQAKTDNDWDGAGTGKMYTSYLTDNVGIGTINPQTELHVVDTRKSTNPSDIDFWPNGILIESDSATPAPNHSPRLGLVDTSLGSITTAPAWYIVQFHKINLNIYFWPWTDSLPVVGGRVKKCAQAGYLRDF